MDNQQEREARSQPQPSGDLANAAKELSRQMHHYLDGFAPAKYRTPFDALSRLDKALAAYRKAMGE